MCERINKRMRAVLTAAAAVIMAAVLTVPSAGAAANGENVWPVELSEENFPDRVFRQYIERQFDYDKDGKLTESEAASVKEIRLNNNKNVTSLKGIEYFPELRELYCSDDSIESLDVSSNQKLTILNCSSNQIKTLNLSQNSLLEDLECFDNPLNSLDLSANTSLKALICGGNQLEEVDLSHNPELTSFAYLAGSLEEIDFSANPKLQQIWISGTPLKELDVSANPELISLLVYITNIETIDLTNNPLLTGSAVNLHSNRLVSVHMNMVDEDQINLADQRAVTVRIPRNETTYDLRNLDPEIDVSAVQGLDGAVIENGIIKEVKPGMEIAYRYTGDGVDFQAHIRFEEANSWIEPLTIEDWTYGETASEPHAKAAFGEVTFTYSDSPDGPFHSEVPTEAGTWYVRAEVKATDTYEGLEAVKAFTIRESAEPAPDPGADSESKPAPPEEHPSDKAAGREDPANSGTEPADPAVSSKEETKGAESAESTEAATGDDRMPVQTAAALAVIAGAGMVITLLYGKKRRKR